MGRPATKPVSLKDGYYIEVKNNGTGKGIIIRRDNIDQIKQAMSKYESTYKVIFLGEMSKGKMKNIKLN